MDLSQFSTDDLLLAALKSEQDSKHIYEGLAHAVKNAFLKDRLLFLAAEEEKHQAYFERIYADRFPRKSIVLPAENVVPLPEIKVNGSLVPISDILLSAMNAEDAAYRFYQGLANRFEGDEGTRSMVFYIASMEKGHYRFLEVERENALERENFDVSWPLVHVGP